MKYLQEVICSEDIQYFKILFYNKTEEIISFL